MVAYQPGIKIGSLFAGTLALLVGLGFVVAGAHGAWGDSPKDAAVELGAIGIGSVAAYLVGGNSGCARTRCAFREMDRSSSFACFGARKCGRLT